MSLDFLQFFSDFHQKVLFLDDIMYIIMPSFSHFVFGFALMIPIIFMAKDRVGYKAIAIFILNNYIGPDSYWVFSFIPVYGHSALGFLVWAIPLAVFYRYLTRFSVKRDNKWFRFVDDGAKEITFRNAYLLTIAGGLCHFFIDMIGHTELDFSLIPGSTLTLVEAQLWGAAYYHNYTPLIVLGFAIQIFFTFVILYFLRQEIKSQFKFMLSMIGIVLVFIAVLGGDAFGELEVSTLLIIGVYFLIPMTLCGLVFRDMMAHPVKITQTRLTPQQKFRIASGVMIGFGILLIVASIVAILESDVLGALFDFDGDLIASIAQFAIFLAIFLTIIAVGMAVWKVNFCRRILMGLCFVMAPIIFPLSIYLILSENEVEQMFTQSKKRDNQHAN
jgi:hypothetical protein